MPEVQFDLARLQALMDRHNLGDTELAHKSDVTRTMIHHLRNGNEKAHLPR
jgi:hypothetical protein